MKLTPKEIKQAVTGDKVDRRSNQRQAINVREWIEIGHVAVRTKSVLAAAKVAAGVKRTRQRGTTDGIEWMCLALFREQLERQGPDGPPAPDFPRSPPRKTSWPARTGKR